MLYKSLYLPNSLIYSLKNNFYSVPLACHCNAEGSESIQCSDLGVCTCKPHITGEKCDQTVPGWYDIEDPKGTYISKSLLSS